MEITGSNSRDNRESVLRKHGSWSQGKSGVKGSWSGDNRD